METIRLDTPGPGGRPIAVWRSRIRGAHHGPVAVLCPGFGRQMGDLVTVAASLAANGVTVYRLDPLDHVGLSAGSILDYTPSATLVSLDRVLKLVQRIERGREIVLVAASMAARPAVRVALRGAVDRLVTVVGVVHMERTIGAVFGAEILRLRREELPASVWFEDHEIRPHRFFDERDAWFDLDGTVAELAALRVPVVAIHADGDPWVDADEVRRAYRSTPNGPRHIVEIRSDCHDLGQDPVAGLLALEEITKAVLDGPETPVLPSLDDLASAIAEERSFERTQQVLVPDGHADAVPDLQAVSA
ncbi:MAG: acyl transferase [Acidimicrobiales bacterium]